MKTDLSPKDIGISECCTFYINDFDIQFKVSKTNHGFFVTDVDGAIIVYHTTMFWAATCAAKLAIEEPNKKGLVLLRNLWTDNKQYIPQQN